RFEREPRVLSSLSHPNLHAIYDIGTEGETHYLVSEYLEGQSLGERMRGGPLPQSKVIYYALQMPHGLDASHEKGSSHLALKRENRTSRRSTRLFMWNRPSSQIQACTSTRVSNGSSAAAWRNRPTEDSSRPAISHLPLRP